MDKATPTLRERSDVALRCLPDSPYRTMLAALFDEMLAEVERLAAQAAPTKISEFPEDYDGLAHLYIQACEERDHLRAVLAAQPSQAPVVQAGEYPPLPEELFSEFWGCVAVWDLSAEGEEAGAEAIRIENVVKGLMRAYVDADRASSGATTQAVRMLTEDEAEGVWGRTGLNRVHYAADVIREFCAVNAGKRIPASGEIGGV